MTELIDISPPISPELAVFPGDTPPTREVLQDMQRGDHLTLSTLHATVHLGAHVDGPNHYGVDAPGVDALPVERFIGPCHVIHCPVAPGSRVGRDVFGDIDIIHPRVLLRTGTYTDPNTWSEEFAGLECSLVDWLAGQGVTLVGIDTPSVDPPTAKRLIAHHRFLANDVSILEGLVLTHVEPGEYELIAAPLRLVGFDASPVRAVLRRIFR